MTILDFLIEAQNQIRFQSSGRIALEAILLRIIRTHQRLPVEFLVKRLSELESAMLEREQQSPATLESPLPLHPPEKPKQESVSQVLPPKKVIPAQETIQPNHPKPKTNHSLTEDPTPTSEDLGLKKRISSLPIPPQTALKSAPVVEDSPSDFTAIKQGPLQPLTKPLPSLEPVEDSKPLRGQSHYDTILQFAAVELEGAVQKKQVNIFK